MVTPEYTLILTPSGSKMALPPRKPPQHKNKSLFPQAVIFHGGSKRGFYDSRSRGYTGYSGY